MLNITRSSFEKVIKEYQEPVRRLFLNLTLGDEMLSDDLAQDTFVKAYTNWSTFKMLSSTKTWLFRIVYNVFYDYRRSLKPTADIDDSKSALNKQTSLNSTEKIDIYEAMKLLSDDEKICVTMALIEGYSMKEISRATMMKESTVKSHIFRGRAKLTTYLKQHGYE